MIGVLLERSTPPHENWWKVGIVWSTNENCPVGGYDLSVHADDMIPMAVEPLATPGNFRLTKTQDKTRKEAKEANESKD